MLDEDSFRLVKIEGATGVVRCQLSTYRRNDAPDYIALSYACHEPQSVPPNLEGATQPEYLIVLDGRDTPVTPNLYYALHELCQPNFGVHWWIDALCIDQSNPHELTAQVLAMHKIYCNALSVYVWLGSDPTNKAYTIREFFRALLAKYLDTDLDHNGHFKIERDFLSLGERDAFIKLGLPFGPPYPTIWWHVFHFWERSWFHRVWVKQEVALAADVQIWCGSTEFTLYELIEASRFHIFSGLSQWLLIGKPEYQRKSMVGRKVGASIVGIEDIKMFLNFGNDFFEADDFELAANRFSGLKSDKQHPLLRIFTVMLFLGRRDEATDPRDKIFTLMILMKQIAENNSLPEVPIEIDYTKQKMDVYREAVRWVIEESRLLGLFALLDPERSKNEMQNGYSWVADFSTPPMSPLRMFQRELSCETSTLWAEDQTTCSPSFRGSSLQLYAKQISTVADIGDNSDSMIIHGCYEMTAKLLLNCPPTLANGLSRFDAWRMTMGGQTSSSKTFVSGDETSDNDSTSLTAFRAWLVFSIVRRLAKEAGEGRIQSACEYMNTMPSLKLLAEADDTEPKLLPDWSFWENFSLEEQEFQKHAMPDGLRFRVIEYGGRRLFRTANNLIGLGPDGTEPGDELWMVCGCTLPVLLRRIPSSGNTSLAETEARIVVGEAYINGLAHVLQDQGLSQKEWTRLVLQ